jgi:outer membrane autotransporter protein
VYGSYSAERLFVDTAISYGRQSFQNYRNLEVGTLQRTAESEHGANAWSAYLSGGYNLGRNFWSLAPLASLQYLHLAEEAFSEEGAGGVSLNVEERKTNTLVSDLGLRLGMGFDTSRGNLLTELFAAWRHDFAIDQGTITASFADTPQELFTIDAADTQADGLLLGASLVFKSSDRFSAALKYNLELRGDYSSNSLIGEIQYGF